MTPDSKFVVTGQWSGVANVWDVGTGELKLSLEGHTKIVHGCAVSPDGGFFVSCSEEKTVRVWNAGTQAGAPPRAQLCCVT